MSESTAMAAYQPQTGALLQQQGGPQGTPPAIVPLDRESLQFYAGMITTANLVPEDRNVPQEVSKSRVMAKIVSGASYGFDPILSQSCFDVLFNRLGLNAQGMEILFRDSGEYDSRITYLKDEACRVDVLKREGGEWSDKHNSYIGGEWHLIGTVEFTYDMAKAAGLPGKNKNWDAFRHDMLYSKVMKRVVKRYNPNCLRPRTLLGNYFAKAHQPLPPTVPEAPAPAQIAAPTEDATPTPAASQPYREPIYTGGPVIDMDDDGAEAVIHEYTGTQADEPQTIEGTVDDLDSETEDLRSLVAELLGTLPANRQKDILAGKSPVSKASHDELIVLKDFLENEK